MATTLFDRVFKGSDEMYDVAVKALEEASAKYPDSEPSLSRTPLTTWLASMQ